MMLRGCVYLQLHALHWQQKQELQLQQQDLQHLSLQQQQQYHHQQQQQQQQMNTASNPGNHSQQHQHSQLQQQQQQQQQQMSQQQTVEEHLKQIQLKMRKHEMEQQQAQQLQQLQVIRFSSEPTHEVREVGGGVGETRLLVCWQLVCLYIFIQVCWAKN